MVLFFKQKFMSIGYKICKGLIFEVHAILLIVSYFNFLLLIKEKNWQKLLDFRTMLSSFVLFPDSSLNFI